MAVCAYSTQELKVGGLEDSYVQGQHRLHGTLSQKIQKGRDATVIVTIKIVRMLNEFFPRVSQREAGVQSGS